MNTSECVEVKVNLIRTNWQAVNRAAEMSGDTKTDTINRAVAVYESIQAAVLEGTPQQITVWNNDGTFAFRLMVLLDPQ